MTLRWLRESTADLERIRAYIARDNPHAAEAERRRIIETVERLGEMPNLGHVGQRAGTRELIAAGLPYIVVYRIEPGDQLVILGIFHGAQER
jgi:plasmid stabilization system protein ParE